MAQAVGRGHFGHLARLAFDLQQCGCGGGVRRSRRPIAVLVLLDGLRPSKRYGAAAANLFVGGGGRRQYGQIVVVLVLLMLLVQIEDAIVDIFVTFGVRLGLLLADGRRRLLHTLRLDGVIGERWRWWRHVDLQRFDQRTMLPAAKYFRLFSLRLMLLVVAAAGRRRAIQKIGL